MTGSSPIRYTLDISRLLSRVRARAPTGIDRVELEYARFLLENAPHRLEFSAVHPLGRHAPLPFGPAAEFIGALGAMWDSGGTERGATLRLGARLLHGIVLPQRAPRDHDAHARPRAGTPAPRDVYLLLSHHHLTRAPLVAAAIKRRNALFVPMVHDLIPLEYPEYSREQEPARHRRRIDTVVSLADAVIVPSEAVRRSLLPYFRAANRAHVPIWSVPHGVHLRALGAGAPQHPPKSDDGRPYFICLGTIEARKNHLLLLNIWRRLVDDHGTRAPRLVIIGKRGWENEQVLDMIERAPALRGVVEEHSDLPDIQVVALLRGARALLFPSFTEGYGLPLAEALALGTASLCSDIPVFREVGGDGAHYLDPIDGIAWLRAIERMAGLHGGDAASMPILKPPAIIDWDESIGRALALIDGHSGVVQPG